MRTKMSVEFSQLSLFEGKREFSFLSTNWSRVLQNFEMQIKRQDKFNRKIRKVRVVSFKSRTSLRWFDILWDVIFVAGNPSFESFSPSLFAESVSHQFLSVILCPLRFFPSRETLGSSSAALFISSWFCSLKSLAISLYLQMNDTTSTL